LARRCALGQDNSGVDFGQGRVLNQFSIFNFQISKGAVPNTRHWICALLVFTLSLLVYARTLAPDITWTHDGGDGGDLITAVMTGGVPHPPGYPTYLLLSWPLARLPLGNPAWRLNLFSALAAAGAAGFTTLTVIQRIAGVSAGLVLAFSSMLWSQAVIAEVYALTALFAALLLFLAIGCSSKPVLFGLMLGLALGASPLLIWAGLMAPLVLGRRIKQWAWMGAGLLIGLGVFVALPVRALSGAPVNWGDTSLDGWWWLVSAQLYRGYVMALPLNGLGTRSAAWAGLVVRQFTPVGALIGVWGMWRLWNTRCGLAFIWLVTFAGVSAFAIGYNTTDSYVYLISALALLAVWVGVGLAEVVQRLDQTGSAQRRLGLATLVLPLVLLLISWPAADASTDRTAVRFGQAIMAQAPDRAILLTAQDAHTFTLWYFHYVRGERPDVMVVDRDMLGMSWYRSTVARESGLASLESPDPVSKLASLGRPVCRVSLAELECK
jgi:hypothetical protein